MNRRKKISRYRTFKVRQADIEFADDLFKQATDLTSMNKCSEPQKRNQLMQAAIFMEAAASSYKKGTLTLMSLKAWTAAHQCYQECDHNVGAKRCEKHCDSISKQEN